MKQVEEAIKEFKSELKWAELNKYPYVSKQKVKADNLAIKALEQESVLDKIEDEIKEMYRVILKGTPKDDWAVKWNQCVDEVLQIIDKYKIEEGNKE